MPMSTPTLDQLAISPSGFVFDPTSGSTFTANATAQALLDGIRGGRTLDELAEHLGEQFDVGSEDLCRDVLEFVAVLRDEGLLPADFQLDVP